jgi:hypothetical protein
VIFSTFNLPEGESLPQSERIRERLMAYARPARMPLPAGQKSTAGT